VKPVAKPRSSKEKLETKPDFLACESRGVFEILMFNAGIMGAYTYNLRGGVFCNAQTANFLMMAVAFGKGKWLHGVYYFIPASAYVLGALLSELLPKPIKRFGHLRWDTLLIGLEILVLFTVGFVPLTAPPQIVQVAINFLASMQYNTFRQANAIPMATTFCTNHVRQFGISLAQAIHTHDKSKLRKGILHIGMILAFVGGAFVETLVCGRFGAKAIWLALIPLTVNFSLLFYADTVAERDKLDRKPLGH